MRSRGRAEQLVGILCLVAVSAAVVLVSTADAHKAQTPSQHHLTFTPGEAQDVFDGVLTSKKAACERGRSITLFREVAAAPDAKVTTAKTDSAGTWSYGLGSAAPGSYYAEAAKKVKKHGGHKHICKRATSNTVVIPPDPPSTFPSDPLDPTTDANGMAHITFASGDYWIRLGPNYDRTHHTPISLLVGVHGCGDTALNYLSWAVVPYALRDTQSYIGVSVGGRDGACWNLATDATLVMNTIADVRTHFNINPRRVILIGYDSGGSLAYHTAFYNAKTFAGLLAMGTKPFASSTGPDSRDQSIAAATWKFNIAQVANTEDTVFPITTVRTQTSELTSAGFPLILTEQAGTHDGSSDDAAFLIGQMGPWLAPPP